MQENSSFLNSPQVTGRIAPCLQRKGGSTGGGGSARARGEPRTPHQAQPTHGSANDTSEPAVHCHEQVFWRQNRKEAGLCWIPALQDGLVCVVTLERGWLF